MGLSLQRSRLHLPPLFLSLAMVSSCIAARNYPDKQDAGDETTTDDNPIGLYHSAGYAAGAAHGIDSNLQADDCRECHGNELEGGTSSIGCDQAGCHTADWRTDCNYCHGEDESGAPPRDIDGQRDLMLVSFPAHKAHVREQNHAPFACTQCHVDAKDILTPGHAYDATPGRAEVDFSAGLSAGAQYDNNGGCANLYCHGNGSTRPGTSKAKDGPTDCASCHPSQNSPRSAWNTMSGSHALHLLEQVTCSECHSLVTDAADAIVGPLLHVNGQADATMEGTGISVSDKRCTGFCHNEGHFYDSW